MRVSTAQIFNSGTQGIGRNQVDLFKLQNQLSTGRKVLTPADDPVASAQALVLTQSKSVTEQFMKNQDAAKGKLNFTETQLSSLGDLLQNVRARMVQGGTSTLTNADRSYVAQELEGRFSELLGIANAQDGSGSYLFSGYQGAVKPFSVVSTGAQYAGDDGKRLLQVDASRQMATNVSGGELFEAIRNGNGSFATATGGNGGVAATPNLGTGIIDQGSVTDPALWTTALNTYSGAQIKFTVAAGVTSYQIFDPAGATPYTSPQTFTPGQTIKLQDSLAVPPVDFGASVVIEGSPANNDTFTVSPSTDQSIFTTLRNAINTLTQGVGGTNTATQFANNFASNLQNVDQALENVTRMRSTIGSSLSELDSLSSSSQDTQLQYSASISNLQDLDWNQAISDMSRKQLQLQAAQLSFKQTSQLSLFSIL